MGRMAHEIAQKIIVVEDDPTFLSFWRRILGEMGVRPDCEFIANALEAKLLLEEQPCRLLISDIIMPGINGYDLGRIAYRRNPECQILLTTAYGTDLSRFDLANCTFHILHKPYIDLVELKKLLKHLLEGDASFDDLSEDSFSENEDYPAITEWKL